MSLLIDTDDEMNRYDEAALYAKTVKPDMAPGIRSSFNVGTGQTDLLAPLPSGGFVKLGSQAPEITVQAPDVMMEAPAMPGMGADAALPVEDDEFQLQSIRNFAASGANISSRDDYLAAGYSDQLIDASGVMGERQQETGSIEPLSTTEIEGILSEGGTVFQNSDPTMRENGATALTETLIELRVDERREELLEQYAKPDASEAETEALNVEISRIIASEQPEMRSLSENLADAVFGNKNVLGTGVGDFVTAGVMDMQEGWRMYTDALRNDSPANRALGVLLMAAGVAEATGVGLLLGKTIKKSIPIMQSALVSAGQNAELRMAERGPAVDFLSSTMMSGVDPTIATDPLVAAAGRAVGGDRVAEIKTKYPNVQLDIYGDAKKGFELGRIEIPETERSSGLGTAVMNDIIKMADDQGAVISLTPDKSFGGSSVSRLKKFYKKFGFVENKGKNKDFSTRNTMIRQPAVTAVDDGFVAKVEPPTDDTPGIIAFHGSAADFDGFKLEKIGTGEGAQAYGYGLYFADKEDIAKYYRDFLSKSIDVDGKPFIRGNNIFDEVLGGDQDLADNLGATQGDLEQAIKEAKETRQEMLDFGNEEAADIYADELYKLEQLRGRVTDNSSKGHMYKVGLVPKPDEMLDYYKPLSEQPDNIQAAYKKAYHNKFIKGDADLEVLFANPNDLTMQDMGIFDKSTGAQAYRELADKLGSIDWPVGADAKTRQEFRTKGEAAASKALFEAGIPGIKFLDNSARKTSGTSSNYVIFDDSMIKILEKYGIVGPVAISAMALSEDES